MAEDGQKTEQPTGRKLAKARERGQVIQSREVNNLLMLSAGAAILLLYLPPVMPRLQATLARFFEPARLIGTDGILWDAVRFLLGEIAAAFVLPIVILVAVALAGTLLQTGLVLATEKIGFDASRLSPIAGLGRLFSLKAIVEFFKNLAKAAMVAVVIALAARPEMMRLPVMPGFAPTALAVEIHHVMLRLAIAVLVAVVALAILDYGYQRFQFLRSMRMSKQEVKEESKQAEGDPLVKSRLRAIRIERARRRMMAAVPTASVVVTNPTHFAVALKYEMGSKGAPVVVAKGADLVAHRIREIAKENDVPLVENPPLARALYATVELDREIPPEHYRAVAEIINYVFRLKGRARAR